MSKELREFFFGPELDLAVLKYFAIAPGTQRRMMRDKSFDRIGHPSPLVAKDIDRFSV